MKTSFHSRYHSSKGAALMIVLALVVLLTGIALAYFSRTTTDRQLAQSSYNDTSADLLVRSALDITVSDLKQEILAHPTPTAAPPYYIQPARYPAGIPDDNPNLIRYSSRNAAASRASTVISTAASANGRIISLARWNSHYLIPRLSTTNSIDSTPVSSFIAPDWVLVTAQGPKPTPAPGAVIGRYAFAVYDEGGLIDMNLGGFPTYAKLSRPTRPTRKLRPPHSLEESEIMLAACQAPGFTPDHINASGNTGLPFVLTPNTNHNPTSFGPDTLPHGLFVNPITGTIFGIPTSPGSFTVTLSASNNCGTGYGTLNLMIDGLPSPDSTPWPVNLARKATVAFADVTTLPSTPTVITPTTPVGAMGGFPSTIQINKIMGWRNYATTQQPTSASFNSPSFPLVSADNYARYFLGAALPFTTPFTTVSTAVVNPPSPGRTDQAVMSRQELIKLQRTIGFSQSLLQYLGTFSREQNRPAPDWPQTVSARWDMNYLALAIPDAWIVHPGHHGQGHGWGLQRHTEFAQRFGLVWQPGNFVLGTRLLDPNYYGRWKYIHSLNPLPANNPDFFQVIDYAMNQANGGVPDPNHVRNTFNVGAALIDQYDTDDLYDPDPNPPANGDAGNTITIIDYDGIPAHYAYGIEGMSFDNPIFNLLRPPFALYPPDPPASYVLLNRRFENVGEFGYAYNPASTTSSKTLDFASSTSHDRAMLDMFTYNSASVRAGTVNLNTRNGPVLASIIRGAFLNDPGAENPPDLTHPIVNQQDALAAGQAIVRETTNNGPALNRGDVARLAAAAAAAVFNLAASDETKQTIARALAEIGQARTWNLMIDVIAQTGKYAPGTPDLADPAKFIVEGEKRYWLHIALDRDDGTVLGSQLEEVIE
jgi:putative Ig domain-containing protein